MSVSTFIRVSGLLSVLLCLCVMEGGGGGGEQYQQGDVRQHGQTGGGGAVPGARPYH